MDAIDELILFKIPDWISFQVNPKLNAIEAATADDSNRTIWILPSNESSPNIDTLIINKIIDLDNSNDILVVDDNSPDGTYEIVKKIKSSNNERVFIIKRESKSGLGSAYKVGLSGH